MELVTIATEQKANAKKYEQNTKKYEHKKNKKNIKKVLTKYKNDVIIKTDKTKTDRQTEKSTLTKKYKKILKKY